MFFCGRTPLAAEYWVPGDLRRDLNGTLYGLACAFSLSARKAPMASSEPRRTDCLRLRATKDGGGENVV